MERISKEKKAMKKYHTIANVHFEADELVLNIDGERKRYPLARVSQVLQDAAVSERVKYEISPSGYGIHWPDLDEDLSIDGLLGIDHKRKYKKQAA
jgi:hypothetical protein